MKLPIKIDKILLLFLIFLLAISAILISLYVSYRKELAEFELRIKACQIEGHPHANCDRGWIVFEVIEPVSEPMSWEAFVDDQKIAEGEVQEEMTVDIDWPSWVLETIGQSHTLKVVADGWYEEQTTFGGPQCVPAPTSTPTPPIATKTPTQAPTSTPTLVATVTPTSIPTSTPTLILTNTPAQGPTSTPVSVTPTPTQKSPTSTPQPQPTNTPTPKPSDEDHPSEPAPTASPVPPSPTPIPLPEAGIFSPTLLLTALSVILVLVGILL